MVTALAHRFTTREPTICAVCRRRAVWLGYSPMSKHLSPQGPVVWLCDDEGCHRAARSAYAMPNKELNDLEQSAALEAGAMAGRYLDQIGITDLAKLTDQQWREFLRRLLTGFEQTLRRKILDGESPF
jgi:Family of unknown function (DUF6511)